MALLEARGLTKRFGGVTALDDVSITVEENTLVGIIGPNGSGKTTFLNTITGFIHPDSGSVLFRGKDPRRAIKDLMIRKAKKEM